MAWQAKSHRIVPSDWHRRKAAVHRRDQGICHACHHPGADEVDHLVNVAAWIKQQLPGDPHDLTNLGLIHGGYCPTCRQRCHVDKTAREARAARPTRKRPPEKHPGLR